MSNSRQIHLKSRPSGLATAENFELRTITVPEPAPGEVQVRNLWMSIDPIIRIRIDGGIGDLPAIEPGDPMEGDAIGEVVATRDPSFAIGDLVHSTFGWRELFNAPTGELRKLPSSSLPPQTFLGVAGMPGLTGYAGLLRVAQLRESDVVFVSAAAGAVGSLVCQIAKIRGHRVIGSTGSEQKCAFLKDIGVDQVINYKAENDLTSALFAAAPEGIDVYFDNVGGEHLEAAITAGRPGARIVLCGGISNYNAAGVPAGPRNLLMMIPKQMRMEGVTGYAHMDLIADFQRDLARWVTEGKVVWRETIFEGIENAPDALFGLFSGENIGKMLVRLA